MHCLLVILAFATNPIIDSADAPRSLQAHAFDSIFRVTQVGVGTGTGFAVDCSPLDEKGKFTVIVVTAWHCVDGNGLIQLHSVRARNAPAYVGSFTATVVASDSDADIAVLKATCDRPIPCLRIADCNVPNEASGQFPAITIGCSNGGFPTIWNVVVQKRESLRGYSGNLWAIDRAGIPGRSGGPLICADFTSPNFGRVHGACLCTANGRSYFSDTRRVRNCLRKAGMDSEPATVTDEYFPRGFVFAALRLFFVAILCSVIRFDGDLG